MKVTKNAVTISELVNWNRFDLNRHTVQVRDADPNELQLFIEKMPASIKGKTMSLKCNFQYFLIVVVEQRGTSLNL